MTDWLDLRSDRGEWEKVVILRDLLLFFMEKLKKQEIDVLRKRFGINESRMKTYEEIGDDLQLSCSRVRQIEGLALRKIRIWYRGEVRSGL